MGNRAVITTKERKIGLYLHWNGGRDTVEPLLKYCELQGYRPPSQDCYGWARMCQVMGNFFGGSLSLGIGAYTTADGSRRQRRLRHRGLAHRRPPANGVRRRLEPHRDALLRAFRRGGLAQVQRDAPRLRRGDARGPEARRLPRCARDPHVRGSFGR